MHACRLSHFSRVQLCVTPWTAAHKAPLSTGFSRQEYWSGVPFPYPRSASTDSILAQVTVILHLAAGNSLLNGLTFPFLLPPTPDLFSTWQSGCIFKNSSKRLSLRFSMTLHCLRGETQTAVPHPSPVSSQGIVSIALQTQGLLL